MPGADADAALFIDRWQKSEASERGNYQTFLSELCDLLGVPRPDPAVGVDADNAYVFDRVVTSRDGKGGAAPGFIDLYKRDCFILEAKQGSETPQKPDPEEEDLTDPAAKPRKTRLGTARRGTARWDQAMLAARGQAERYARSLPPEEGNPPLLITCDIGHTFELYADFSRLGRTYTPFSDPAHHRIRFERLTDAGVRETLRLAWTDPLALDPARRSAAVTRDIADRLAALSRSLEKQGEEPEVVADFLMRVLFTLFAEDIDLIPKDSFTEALRRIEGKPELFAPLAEDLWAKMNTGGFAGALSAVVLRFNGGLFERNHAVTLNDDQLKLLLDAAEKDWTDVEPASFGTLLERALNPRERHKLGAHYTPRAYVERLVLPTVIEPLRERWSNAQAAAVTLDRQGKPKEARAAVSDFLSELCNTSVLDPACGSGNFLYVTLEHMKRLEAEVRQTLVDLGGQDVLEGTGLTVDPHLLKGIELNPRAAAIADLVLWIGHLQWHHRTSGGAAPAEPVLRKFENIENRDAVLAYDEKKLVTDEHGKPVTRWDGRTTKKHPVTGEDVPDESAREPVWEYVNPRKAKWPEADYVVGNPPFIGNRKMRELLGDGYTDAIRAAFAELPESMDFVMYWWHVAAEAVANGRLKASGFITTNSISQIFNRRVVERSLQNGTHLATVIPDHPWVAAEDGAAVRIAMTVVRPGGGSEGTLIRVIEESATEELHREVEVAPKVGVISSKLSIGFDVEKIPALLAADGLCGQGIKLVNSRNGGFYVDGEVSTLPLNTSTGQPVVRDYVMPPDVRACEVKKKVIDFCGMTADEAREAHPDAYHKLLTEVKPIRDQNSRKSIRDGWWRFAWERPELRGAIKPLSRYLVTLETAKYRFFRFVEASALWDGSLFAVALEDSWAYGVLNSGIHDAWCKAAKGDLGPTPRYNRQDCFEKFPFPEQGPLLEAVGAAADELMKLRDRCTLPSLDITKVYNVFQKDRGGESLTKAERTLHRRGLVSVLKQLHDDLDAAVFAAYGWTDLWERHLAGESIDEPLLERLVALNAERAAEEATGHVRWLRPDFQNPGGSTATGDEQKTLDLPDAPAKKKGKAKKLPWPDTLPAQTAALRDLLAASPTPLTPDQIATRFARSAKRVDLIHELCQTLTSLGLATETDDQAFAA